MACSIAVAIDSAIVLHADADTGHQSFSRLLSLLFDVLPHDLVASPEHESYKSNANKQCETQENDVDRHGIVLEDLVRCGVECGL